MDKQFCSKQVGHNLQPGEDWPNDEIALLETPARRVQPDSSYQQLRGGLIIRKTPKKATDKVDDGASNAPDYKAAYEQLNIEEASKYISKVLQGLDSAQNADATSVYQQPNWVENLTQSSLERYFRNYELFQRINQTQAEILQAGHVFRNKLRLMSFHRRMDIREMLAEKRRDREKLIACMTSI